MQEFLQAGLGILVGIYQGQAFEFVGQPGEHPLAGGVHARIQVDGADQRLQCIGEDGLAAETAALQLARAQAQVLAQLEATGQQGQGLALHQPRTQP
ncbi:hypothetical protein D9M70_435080 [compost metagenome]